VPADRDLRRSISAGVIAPTFRNPQGQCCAAALPVGQQLLQLRFTKAKDCAAPATAAISRSDPKTILRFSLAWPTHCQFTVVAFEVFVVPALQLSNKN